MYTQNNAMMPNPQEQKFILPAMVESSDFTADELAEDMEGLSMSFTRVKIPSGGMLQFEIPSDDPDHPTYSPTLVGVILHNHAHCAYWPEGSDDDDNKPICSSVDGKQGIGTPGGTCATCALNSFGSASKGNGKACKNMRVLYLLRSNDYMPIQINLPPTSIRPWKDFMQQAFVMRRRATFGSVVQIGLKKDSNGKDDYSVATFRRLYDFAGEELQQVRAYATNFKDQLKMILEQRAQANADMREDVCEYGAAESLPMGDTGAFCITAPIDGEREALPD